jgi:hypothetical protein
MSSLAVRAAITGGHYLNRLFNPYSCQSGKTRFKTRVVDELGCRLSIPHDKPLVFASLSQPK